MPLDVRLLAPVALASLLLCLINHQPDLELLDAFIWAERTWLPHFACLLRQDDALQTSGSDHILPHMATCMQAFEAKGLSHG
jgi:hypothetical protein